MKNKVAVITGGARGLGREFVLLFYQNHYKVGVNYHKSDSLISQLLQTMRNDSVMPLKADVRKADEVRKIARDVLDRWQRIDVLINNAGITMDSLLVKQREDDWDAVLDTNVKGAFNTITAFVPLMKDGGHIVNISSYSGLKGKAGQGAYSASKAALLGLTRSAAREFAEKKIRVNAILPGYLRTGMGLNAGKAMKAAEAESLLNCLSDPVEVAKFVLHLAETTNITGQVFCLESRVI
ncbi:MAG: SDR family NAD(P)-dependent oxidoreductase [Dissulfurispiraceae bacterium]